MSDSTEGPQVEAPAAGPAEATRRRSRRALWGALAVLAVAAGTLAVVASDGDGGSPRLPIALGAGSEETKGAPAAADMAMAAWVHYVAGDDLPLLGGDGPAYRVSGSIDKAALRRVAEALGMEGEPTERDGLWHLESGGATLEAYEGGGGTWWYTSASLARPDGSSSSGGGSAGSPGCAPDATECVTTSDPGDGAVVPTTTVLDPDQPVSDTDCPVDTKCAYPEPEPFRPPADLPTKDEATTIATDLLRSTGAAVDDATVIVDGPYDAWYVSIEPKVEGLPVSQMVFTAAVGPKGEILSAAGVINTAERVGDYPTLDTRAAIDRLNEGGYYGGGREAMAEDLAVQDTVTMETTATEGMAAEDPSTTLASPETAIACDPAADCVDSGQPTEPTEIVLHEAERVLVLVYANDDSTDVYLVPGYRFRGDDEVVVDVPSVDDESLLPASKADDVPEQTPVPDEGTTRCAQPEPGPDGAVPDICLDPNTVEPAEPSEPVTTVVADQ